MAEDMLLRLVMGKGRNPIVYAVEWCSKDAPEWAAEKLFARRSDAERQAQVLRTTFYDVLARVVEMEVGI